VISDRLTVKKKSDQWCDGLMRILTMNIGPMNVMIYDIPNKRT